MLATHYTLDFFFLFVYFCAFRSHALTISHSQLVGMLYNISYSILIASLGRKELLLLNIFYVCMTPTWSLLPI